MGGGNGQKAKMARERNMEKSKAAKGAPFLFCRCFPPRDFGFLDTMEVFFRVIALGVLRFDGSACF
jgi:hypothetical protein